MTFLQLIRIRVAAAAPGLALAAIGLACLAVALGQPFRLPSGRPGPGFVPALIAGALVALGLLQAATARGAPPAGRGGARAGAMLCLAVAGFALLLPWVGFLPASWAAGSLALAAAPGLRLRAILAGGAALAVAATALFLGALGLPTPVIGLPR
ncbi:hypothetical protein G3576_10400 [Roseomonas stagni]|uniref:DUF1468 domain-containing protein n=1 Tax=Falsiroseomonas algicola TaxID=2716930 RepID=A0A6M1LKU1_9PROT|nr:tripartite tricarboxylate transporter TctB family protein [Falsiroseomonas algicola]NGM20424.1 hypothetical protein [Falsiroseomonas algicola]